MWADLCYISEINGKTTFLFTVIKGLYYPYVILFKKSSYVVSIATKISYRFLK